MINDPYAVADFFRLIVILACVTLGWQITLRVKIEQRGAWIILGAGLTLIAAFVGGTEILRFGHDVGYWRLPVGITGMGLLNAAIWQFNRTSSGKKPPFRSD